MTEPKYGIIGCGYISKFHVSGLLKAGAKIVHFADIDISRAKDYAAKTGAKASSDYNELLDNKEVTVVNVLPTSRLHKEIALAAIKKGKDVICEKTLSVSGNEAVEIARAAKEAKNIFFTCYMKRFFPAVRKAKELMPQIGTLFSAYARTYQPWGDLFGMDKVPPECAGDEAGPQGGRVIRCCGSHLLDLTFFLMGRPKSLYANISYIPGSKYDRKGIALLEYDGPLVAAFEAAGHPLEKIGFEQNSWDERMEINGSKGRIDIFTPYWDKPEHNAARVAHYDNSTRTSTEYRFDAVNPFDLELAYFHKCLSERKQGDPGVIDGLNVDIAISAMEESHEKKKPVVIDWKGF